MSLDLAIRNGWLVDGSGDARRIADVGIAGDRIVQIGRVGPADTEVDATGLIVAPGFVDPHSHSDWTIHANPGRGQHDPAGRDDGGRRQLRDHATHR